MGGQLELKSAKSWGLRVYCSRRLHAVTCGDHARTYLASSMSESEPVCEGKVLRSGKFVAAAVRERAVKPLEMDGDTANADEKLRALVDELQQKLNVAEQAIDDKDGELCAAQDALQRAKEEAEDDLRAAEEAKRELIRNHKETVRTLEGQIDEYKGLLEKQEVQLELARLQSLQSLQQNFDKERETYLSRIQHLERELEKKSALVVPSTNPKEPETRKRDDSATSGVGELRESGVKEKASSKKGSGSESLDGKGNPSESTGKEHAS